jgi:hypothetical protein
MGQSSNFATVVAFSALAALATVVAFAALAAVVAFAALGTRLALSGLATLPSNIVTFRCTPFGRQTTPHAN